MADVKGTVMRQKREQLWWLGACVVGLLIAAWAAGGFVGPLVAIFIVLFMAGAVLVEFDGRDRAVSETATAESESVPVDAPETVEPDATEADVTESDSIEDLEAQADLLQAANSLA